MSKTKDEKIKRTYDISFRPISVIGDEYGGIYKRIIINDTPSNYMVNNLGFVVAMDYARQHYQKKLRERITNGGYHVVTLHCDDREYKCMVHILVALAFVPNPENKPQVNHIYSPDKHDKYNNSAENLEWVTEKENMQHASLNGLLPKGKDHYMYKYTDDDVHHVCQLLEENELTIREIADAVGVSKNFVHAIKDKKIRTDISQLYDIDKYSVIAQKKKKCGTKAYTKEQLHEVCRLLVENELRVYQIADKVGINPHIVSNVKNHKYKFYGIPDLYDFSHYDKT